MLEVKLNRGKYKLEPEVALKILKKKLLKEGTLRDLRDRQAFVSDGRKAYLKRMKRRYFNSREKSAC